MSFPTLRRMIASWICLAASTLAVAADAPAGSRKIEFPDLPGYQTLACDFHQHTVFSDAEVWPTIRVQEAARDGIDAMAITDHLEHQPHKADVPHADRNRGFEIASAEAAKAGDVLVIRGSEVTRDLPPGHVNALFLQDANPLLREHAIEALEEAARQDAFLVWNHPSWIRQKPDGVAQLTDLHRDLFARGWIKGIEVVNKTEFSDEALQIGLDHNLTLMANSDIHGLIDWTYDVPGGGHRPCTLVFAKEKTAAAIKEALLARRTVVWSKNSLIGRAEWLDPLLAVSLTAKSGGYMTSGPVTSTVVALVLTNHSDADFVLRNASPYRLHDQTDTFIVKAHQTLKVGVKPIERVTELSVAFEVLNAITAPGVHATRLFQITLAPDTVGAPAH